MEPVIVRNVKIGEGIPKICVPIVGVTRENIIEEAKALHNIPADVAEWRADWFENVFDFNEVEKILRELRKTLGEIPLLFTFRTSGEGGEKEIERNAYVKLNKLVTKTGFIDIIDIEVFTGDSIVKEMIEQAHGCGVKVIASNHDFNGTPEKDVIVGRLRRMQELGADIPKIAVMPGNKKDVLTLLSATREMAEEYADRPISTMSMSGNGVISRLSGEIFGSAMTFGAAKKASAPGQMGVEDLRQVLQILHKSTGENTTLSSKA